jgi:hypothetical protein
MILRPFIINPSADYFKLIFIIVSMTNNPVIFFPRSTIDDQYIGVWGISVGEVYDYSISIVYDRWFYHALGGGRKYGNANGPAYIVAHTELLF